jgi:hypothetical protein
VTARGSNGMIHRAPLKHFSCVKCRDLSGHPLECS